MKFIRRIFYLLAYHLYAKRKISRTDDVNLLGFKLTIHPTVFHPQLFFSSKFLGEHVSSLDLKGKRVLDMGTGSGIIGLCAARSGASVVSADINPAAVECARQNAVQNGLANSITMKLSDLFSDIAADEKFDMIIWNPPFYRASPTNAAEHAWNAGAEFEFLRQFATDSKAHLCNGGSLLLILSSVLDGKLALGFFSSNGFRFATVAERKVLFETLTILQFKIPQ